MKNPLLSLYNLLNYIVPPRRGEKVVEALTIDDLYNLQTEDGLPYHEKRVAALVWELKYFANPHAAMLAGQLLADELVMLASEEVGKPLLIPVPMHATRRKERGYNQTELICEAVLKNLHGTSREKVLGPSFRGYPQTIFSGSSAPFEYAPNVLIRKIATPQQQGLPKHKRLHNVEGSMEVVDKEQVKGRVCFVVDDVKTTGATLGEAKRALKAAGARKVVTVALAHS